MCGEQPNMARTKQEVIDFLESQVGKKVVCVGNPSLNGQCVTLIKSLMEFLEVPNPYKARGDAKVCISAYLKEGIADKGTGFISVFSNKDMGGGYGHVWCNAGEGNGTYYESNGVKPLKVTKGKTYSYDMICNFDKYIKETMPEKDALTECLSQHKKLVSEADKKDKAIKGLETEVSKKETEIKGLKTSLEEKETENTTLGKQVSAYKGEVTKKEAQITELQTQVADLQKDSQKDVAGETSKESMRLLVSGIVGTAVTYLYSQYPVLGQIGVEQSVAVVTVVAFIFRLADKAIHTIGKNIGNDTLKSGLIRF